MARMKRVIVLGIRIILSSVEYVPWTFLCKIPTDWNMYPFSEAKVINLVLSFFLLAS